ncbi:hypothetical protein QR680_019118 [Steinernema hermaphroditum]|uniref:Dynactin subunit 4 n=1 Tax=Steinernema hermaphroditum TaxID=289476 RepID=A0AA39HJZ9_9BILA|nr:hypothetical protein QR680_019118 [Steinernema hermaphroditum]
MSYLLNTKRVKCKCSCGQLSPLDALYFCRSCVKPKCRWCVVDEVDFIYCPACLENVPLGDAKNRRYECRTCKSCPLCDSSLTTCLEGELYHLRCGTCKWTTRDVGLADQANSAVWPQHTHPCDSVLNNAMEQLRLHSAREKAEKRKLKYANIRRSNRGTLNTNRYKLQEMYEARRKALSEPLKPMVRGMEPTEDVPELDEKVFTSPFCETRTLSQTMNQLFSKDKPLYPNRIKLAGKRAVRCSDCEKLLYKPEYSPSCIKFRIQCLLLDFVPGLLNRVSNLRNTVFDLDQDQEYQLARARIMGIDTKIAPTVEEKP